MLSNNSLFGSSVVMNMYIYFIQVDAMKVGVKDFKKAYKNVKIDDIEVCTAYSWICWCCCCIRIFRPTNS